MKELEKQENNVSEKRLKTIRGFISITIGLAMLGYTVGTIFKLKQNNTYTRPVNEFRQDIEKKMIKKLGERK